MARLANVSGAVFVLPDGTEIANGGAADVKADVLEVPGVAQMIDAGKLEVEAEKAKAKPKPEPQSPQD